MNDSGRWFWLAIGAVAAVLAYLLAPVLAPFAMAAILAYIGDPLVDRLERLRLSRTLAVVVVFLGLLLVLSLLLLVLIPLVERQLSLLVAKLPGYLDWLQQQALPWLQAKLGLAGTPDLWGLKQYASTHWQSAGGAVAKLLASLSHSSASLLGWLANLLIVPVATFYLLRDWDLLVARIRGLLPRHVEADAVALARDVDEVLGAFFRGQLSVMLALGVVYTTGLWLVGLDLALLIGLVAGLVSFVPYLGFIVGIVSAGLAALMQFHDALHPLLVVLVFGVGQVLEGTVLTPTLLGERIGLHPVAVMFAVLAGGKLFGFFGVLLALPVAAVLLVLLRHLHRRYLNSRLYSAANRD